MSLTEHMTLPTPEQLARKFTQDQSFTFIKNSSSKNNELLAVVDGREYKFPFPFAMISVADFLSARMKAIHTGKWEQVITKNTDKDRWFVDGKYGTIRLSIRTKGTQIEAEGSIFNPKHGEAVLVALKEVLNKMAEEFHKPVRYKTYLVNKTQSLKDLLTNQGFRLITFGENEGEFELIVHPSSYISKENT
jgi:hypothetical protein